jgi:uncharacterized paraquat-inducible protein A
MTRAEFITTQAESERQIRRRVIPFGIIYTLRLASPLVILVLAIFTPLVWSDIDVGLRATYISGLVVFTMILAGSFPLERRTKRQYQTFGLRCPSCQYYLIFISGLKTVKTGFCYHCGHKIFDP